MADRIKESDKRTQTRRHDRIPEKQIGYAGHRRDIRALQSAGAEIGEYAGRSADASRNACTSGRHLLVGSDAEVARSVYGAHGLDCATQGIKPAVYRAKT